MMKYEKIRYEQQEDRILGQQKLERFTSLFLALQGSVEETSRLENPQQRVEMLRVLDSETFLDLLSSANGLLQKRKVTRWEGVAANSKVSMLDVVDLEPADHAEIPFSMLCEQLKGQISVENLPIWAAKVYIGIIFAHLFPDGNGRLARNTYSFLKTGKLLETSFTSERPPGIDQFCGQINQAAVWSMLVKEGIVPGESMSEIFDVQLKIDAPIGGSLTDSLRYIAGYRAGLLKGNEKYQSVQEWNSNEVAMLEKEFQEVKLEHFWAAQQLVDEHAEWCVEQLDNVLDLNNKKGSIPELHV